MKRFIKGKSVQKPRAPTKIRKREPLNNIAGTLPKVNSTIKDRTQYGQTITHHIQIIFINI